MAIYKGENVFFTPYVGDPHRRDFEIFADKYYEIIFSDDIGWCKENLSDLNNDVVFVEGHRDYEDLFMMSYCDHNITSNSSFSWWRAWLNTNPLKIVVAPKNWFGPMGPKDTQDLIPESFIKL